MKRGIIQSRGLGDIIMSLPIARYYYEQGDEIHWPVCEEFYSSVVKHVPWVKWYSLKTDTTGDFFYKTPLQIFQKEGIELEEVLYLYQYLSSNPELTDAELYSILKFDQYKYWVANVPFVNKWNLAECITRDPAVEKKLLKKLKIKEGERYAITHLSGSNFKAELQISWLDKDVRIINVDDHLDVANYSIFDWIGTLEGCEAFIGVDSSFTNLVDCLMLDIPDLYWVRRSNWDLTPVMGLAWKIVPTNLPINEPKRVNPAEMAGAKAQASSSHNGGMTTHAPFKAAGVVPDNFMSALTPAPIAANARLNAPLDL